MRIIQEFMRAINQIGIGEMAMVSHQFDTSSLTHFKIKMVNHDCFEVTILDNNFKITDDVRHYTISGVISLLLNGVFRDGQGKPISPVAEMDKLNGEKVRLNSTVLCLN